MKEIFPKTAPFLPLYEDLELAIIPAFQVKGNGELFPHWGETYIITDFSKGIKNKNELQYDVGFNNPDNWIIGSNFGSWDTNTFHSGNRSFYIERLVSEGRSLLYDLKFANSFTSTINPIELSFWYKADPNQV
ncbi:MAG: hypothetical protein ACTSVV_14390, partial [Promethearchaeota archaeon]